MIHHNFGYYQQRRNIHYGRRVRSKIKSNIILFNTILFIDGIPTYYSVEQDGGKFTFQPSYENISHSIPLFTIWNDGKEWLIDIEDVELIDRDILAQVIKDIGS